jgi:hypothetical protein
VFRVICLVLAFTIVGCAQHVTSFAPTGSQTTMLSSGANAVEPAGSVSAHVALKNQTSEMAELKIEWSYAADPFWHEEARFCLFPGRGWDTKVVFNHIEWGPQIRFSGADTATCGPKSHTTRTVVFRAINFDPDAHFEAVYRSPSQHHWTLCAHGGGNKEVCDSR